MRNAFRAHLLISIASGSSKFHPYIRAFTSTLNNPIYCIMFAHLQNLLSALLSLRSRYKLMLGGHQVGAMNHECWLNDFLTVGSSQLKKRHETVLKSR